MYKRKFYLFCFVLMVCFISEIIYLKNKNYYHEKRAKFVELTKINSFAFYTQTPYLRHQFGHGINEVYNFHPAFRESKIGSFTNSGYAKRFIKKEI